MSVAKEPEQPQGEPEESSEALLRRLREELPDTTPLFTVINNLPLENLGKPLLPTPTPSAPATPGISEGKLTNNDWAAITQLLHPSATPSQSDNQLPIPSIPVQKTPSQAETTEVADTELQPPTLLMPLPPGASALANIVRRLRNPDGLQISESTTNYALAINILTGAPPEYGITFRDSHAANPNPIDIISGLLVHHLIPQEQRHNAAIGYQVQQLEGNLRTLNSMTRINENNEWSILEFNKRAMMDFLTFLKNYLGEITQSDPRAASIIELCIQEDRERIDNAPER